MKGTENSRFSRTGVVCAGAVLLAAALFLWIANDPWNNARLWEKVGAGKKFVFKESVAIGLWFGVAASGLIALLAVALSPWWSRSGVLPEDTRFPAASIPRWAIPLVLLAMLTAGALRWNFAHESLWWDETWNLRQAVLGVQERDEADPAKLIHKPVSWAHTFFYYNKPTNHIPFSVTSRLSVGAWQKLTGAQAWEFDEFAFRFPNFLFSLAAVAVIAWLLCEWGLPGAGVFAAFLLAIHPWHVRYGIDGRSFSLLLLLSLVACVALTRFLRGGTWPSALAFGASLAGMLWAFPYSIYLCITLGCVGLAMVWTIKAEGKLPRFWRFAVGLAFGAALLMPLIGPLVPQMMAWTDVKGNNMINPPFLRELWAGFASGIPYSVPQGPGAEGLPDIARGSLFLRVMLFGIVPLLCVAGAASLAKRRKGPALVWLGLAVAVPFAMLVAWKGTHYFYTRYVIYGLGAVIIAIAAAVMAASNRLPAKFRPALPCAMLVLFVFLFSGQLRVLLSRPYSPNREVAQHLRQLAGEDPDSILAAGFNLGGDMPGTYNPHLYWFENMDGLVEFTARAKDSGKPLYIFYGYPNFNHHDEPEPLRYLDDPAYFEPVQTFNGIEPQFHYTIFKYTGAPIPRG